jgi:hypothetical protein
MKRFVEGIDRGQSTLFAERLEDWICERNDYAAGDSAQHSGESGLVLGLHE